MLSTRPETAASVAYLVSLLASRKFETPCDSNLRILDLCTGTGCIPLLFHHEFYAIEQQPSTLDVIGIDLSTTALSLARENLIHQIAAQAHVEPSKRTKSLHRIGFLRADVLKDELSISDRDHPTVLEALKRDDVSPVFDILISNPPYISLKEFRRTTARSVRDFEPKSALVPPESADATDDEIGDAFYPNLLRIADHVHSRVLLFEVADMDQARRVVHLISAVGTWDNVEIWRDEPGTPTRVQEEMSIGGRKVRVRGAGEGRSVFAHRKRRLQTC